LAILHEKKGIVNRKKNWNFFCQMKKICHPKKKQLTGLLSSDQLQYISAHSGGFQVVIEGRIGHQG
jgi:hypothetical protein